MCVLLTSWLYSASYYLSSQTFYHQGGCDQSTQSYGNEKRRKQSAFAALGRERASSRGFCEYKVSRLISANMRIDNPVNIHRYVPMTIAKSLQVKNCDGVSR